MAAPPPCPPQELDSEEDDEDYGFPERVQPLEFDLRVEGGKRVLYRAGMEMDLAEAERLFTIQSVDGSDRALAEDEAKRAELFNIIFGKTMPKEASRACTMLADAIGSAETGDVRPGASRDLCLEPAPRSSTEPVTKVERPSDRLDRCS
eukprot:TRINITY_DN31486_c0_g2_i1.p1 TRINITY_DN31486_c0_g2~~TRINITY_DN31486_c0_g2_i1.p1  ORF type:complete len:149 (-),score=35.80 TRINITY_DN31486_c0_g2_i1:557-1003(-)